MAEQSPSAAAAVPPQARSGLRMLALGVVFADIATSPLYAVRAAFTGPGAPPVSWDSVVGLSSLIFWALVVSVTLRTVIVLMRADIEGEGGAMALHSLAGRAAEGRTRLAALVAMLGMASAGLFYADAMITPAISVRAAVQGLPDAYPQLGPWVAVIAATVLAVQFACQRQVSEITGAVFGPIMIIWFVVLFILGVRGIAQAPSVLWALSPHHAVRYLLAGGQGSFVALASVVLVVAGSEALYADMGRFGKLPIRLFWYLLVLPVLWVNYLGQGALLIADPSALNTLFFRMAPAWSIPELTALAVAAAVIATQSLLLGAFGVTRQAIRLGYLPRMEIIHTSKTAIDSVYIPFLNGTLALAAIGMAVVLSMGELTDAYAAAVAGTLLCETALVAVVAVHAWGWKRNRGGVVLAVFAVADLLYGLAALTGLATGGWVPLAVAGTVATLLSTWKYGWARLRSRMQVESLPLDTFLGSTSSRIHRVPGTAVFITDVAEETPLALLHNIKHNKCLHERVVILTPIVEEVPLVPADSRIHSHLLSPNVHIMTLRYGYMEDPNIPKALAQAKTDQLGFFYEPMSISYFLSRETVIPTNGKGLDRMRGHLFAQMSRAAADAMDFYHLPCNRVVELGAQVEL